MSKSIPGNQKHLTLDDRIAIEKGLEENRSLRSIAAQLSKDPTTISKEIKKHRIIKEHQRYNESPNRCALRGSCTKKNICGTFAPICKRFCRQCNQCNSHCSDFTPKTYHCNKLDHAPFVCNSCEKKVYCRLDKAFYKASTAHKHYRTVLIESRKGINISPEDFAFLDELISPLVRQGHSPYMILQNHPEIALSEKTIYNYIALGVLRVKNIDLPKKVVYKVRNSQETENDTDSSVFGGHTYKDFQAFITEYPDTPITEMDTVMGCEGSRKVLLTLHFDNCAFMMAYLMESKAACHVKSIFDGMERAVGTLSFCKAFAIILTDRGGEFRMADALECGEDNLVRTSIYYCDPMCSWQKPHCEKNHEYIRKICPKGTNFDNYTQEDINLMMSHINSSVRDSLGGLTPMALAKLMLPKELLDYFGLQEIPSDEIILTPALLKK